MLHEYTSPPDNDRTINLLLFESGIPSKNVAESLVHKTEIQLESLGQPPCTS